MACEGGACARRFDFDADAFFLFDFDREVAIMTGTAPPIRPMMMMGTGMHTTPCWTNVRTCMQILALTCHVKVCCVPGQVKRQTCTQPDENLAFVVCVCVQVGAG